MGCNQSRGKRGAGSIALNYDNCLSARVIEPATDLPPLEPVPLMADRGAVRIGLADLPQDYQRLIVEAVYVDSLLPGGDATLPKVRCVFVQYKSELPLAGIAISTVSGTLWENVLYPNDPNRPQGIAHLVEHLIYSKPSPEADDVRQWFADRNGDSNACTTDSDMRLWLTVPPKFLKEAVGMMLQCMYGRDAYGDSRELEREMLSVDEEYSGMSDQYEVRVVSLLKKICHPSNPWHNCFTCGNSRTLSEKLFPDIRDRCFDFHTNVLKQQDVNICLVSSHSCDELAEITRECALKARVGQTRPTKPLPLRTYMPRAFTTGVNLPAVLILDAYEWKCEFRFVLQEFRGLHTPAGTVPEEGPLKMSWRSKLLRMQGAMSFISHMFRQQTAGSFLSVLLEKGLTYGVSGCRSYAGIEQNFFDIEFLVDENYTETGDPEGLPAEDPATQGVVWLRLMRRIGRALFGYLKLLSSEFSKDPAHFQAYNDFQIIKHFQYQSTSGPEALNLANDIASKLSSSLRRGVVYDDTDLHEFEGVKTTDALAQVLLDPPPFDNAKDMADAVAELVDQHLIIDNAICILAGPKFSEKQYPAWLVHRGSWLLDKEALRADARLKGVDPDTTPTIIWETDPWFSTKYTICELPDKLGDYFREAHATASASKSIEATPSKSPPLSDEVIAASGQVKKHTSTSCAAAAAVTQQEPGIRNLPTMHRHNSIFGGECLEQRFSVQQHNKYLPKGDDLKLRRLESVFAAENKPGDSSQVSVITPSKTLLRVGENLLPPTAQLYLHRHKTDIVGTIQCTARFFLPCLQAAEQEVGKIHRQGTMTEVGKSFDQSGFLAKMLMGKILLRCVANRLRAVSNEAAVAGINFNIAITSPMNEGQVALELSIAGYSGSNTRDLYRYIFDALLKTTEAELGDLTRAAAELKNNLSVQSQNCKYDGRSQLNPNLGLVLIPVSVPLKSQLKVLESMDKRDVLKFAGVASSREPWTVAHMFRGATVVCAIGGNVAVDEAIEDWMTHCLLEPLKNRGVELGLVLEPDVSSVDGVTRLPFHVSVLDLDHLTELLPVTLKQLPKQTELLPYPPDALALPPADVGYEYVYAYNSNDVGNIVQINVNCDDESDSLSVGLLIVLLKAIEQEFFSWIRDVNNLAYYLSVTLKTIGLDGSVLSFAVCSTTASLAQLLQHSLEIIEAPRSPDAPVAGAIENSLSRIWRSAEAFENLRDSVVHMLKEDSDVEGLGNRHRVILAGLFSGAHDYDSNLEVAELLAKASHQKMIDFTNTILKKRSRIVQLSCDPSTAAALGVKDFQYDAGPANFSSMRNSGLGPLLKQAAAIDGRTWLQLRDPRSLHKLLFAAKDQQDAGFVRRPRAYRRGTVVSENGPAAARAPVASGGKG